MCLNIRELLFVFLCVLSNIALAQDWDSPWGVSAHPNRPMEKANKNLFKAVGDAGITWLREDFRYAAIFKGDSLDFSQYDNLMERAEREGIKILPILQAYDSELLKNHRELVPIYEHTDAWRAYVRAVVKRYHKRLKVWEIWNEQDGGFWKPKPDAEQYARLLKIAYEEIKKINPDCLILVGGLNGWNAEYMKSLYKVGAKGYFDMVAVHPYNWGIDGSKKMANERNTFMQVLEKEGQGDIPIWITESGGTTFSADLILRHPDFMLKAIDYSLEKLYGSVDVKRNVALALSPRVADINEVETQRKWLPGLHIQPIPYQELSNIDIKKYPVLIGAEGLNIDEPLLEQLLDYVKNGGLLVAVNKVPFHTVHKMNDHGIWTSADKAKETYPFFRMGFEAVYTKPGYPEFVEKVSVAEDARKAGLPQLDHIYLDRYLSPKNLKVGDRYFPIIQGFDKKGNPVGEGMALYTFKDWKGGILMSLISVETGFTELEQANLLQRMYLSYLSVGVKKIFWYDLHNDGIRRGEREDNFGLVHYDWKPKPAYYAFQEMTRKLGAEPKFVKRLTVSGTDSIWALVFQRKEDQQYVLCMWSTNDQDRYKVNHSLSKKTGSIYGGAKLSFIELNEALSDYKIEVLK